MTPGGQMNIANTAVIGVRPSPHVIAGHLLPDDERAVFEWISLNTAAILGYWDRHNRASSVSCSTGFRSIRRSRHIVIARRRSAAAIAWSRLLPGGSSPRVAMTSRVTPLAFRRCGYRGNTPSRTAREAQGCRGHHWRWCERLSHTDPSPTTSALPRVRYGRALARL